MMSNCNILIVDDEPVQCKLMQKFITNLGYNVLIMNEGNKVVDFFLNNKTVENLQHYNIDVILLDLSMPDIDGLTILKKINHIKNDTQIIVLTANNNIDLAISAMNLGAIDYISKGSQDVSTRIETSIKNAIDKKNLKYQVLNLSQKNQNQTAFSDIIGQNEKLLIAIENAKKAANITIPILIEGESGTGKEMIARAIHGSGTRSGKPFIAVDCSMLKPEKTEEIIFGLEISPDKKPKIGKIREAENGTIFLKKIDTLTTNIQIKILRFLQDGEFRTVDGSKLNKANVRLIASTTKSLEKLTEEKKFREDLRYALSIFPISLPSLESRGKKDIILLAEHFLKTFAINENKKIKSFHNSAIDLITSYKWADNVRQLKNYIFRAVILCDEEKISQEHFPQILNQEQEGKSFLVEGKTIVNNDDIVEIFDKNGHCKSMLDIKEEVAKKLMKKYDNNVSEVAKGLKVARSTLYRKIYTENL